MPVMSWNGWPRLAAACALLSVVACAPNSARTPMEPRLAASMKQRQAVATDGNREEGRYGTLLRLAASARAGGDPAAAVSLYQQAIADDRGRIDAYVLLGDTLLEMEAFDDAATAYQDVLGRDGDNVAAHRGYARAMLGLNRPEVAVVHYQAVLGEAPNDLQAHNGLGVAYDLAGQHEAAQDAYRAGLNRAGQHAPAQQSRPVAGAVGQPRRSDRNAARRGRRARRQGA
jgi:tetratricopeptide (TPR) repeat protein